MKGEGDGESIDKCFERTQNIPFFIVYFLYYLGHGRLKVY